MKALNSALALARRGVMQGDDDGDAVENLTCRCDADDGLQGVVAESESCFCSCRVDADFFRIPLGSPPQAAIVFMTGSCRCDADFFIIRTPLGAIGSPSNTNAILTGASASSSSAAQLLTLAAPSAKLATTSCAAVTTVAGCGGGGGGAGLHDPHSNLSSDASLDTTLLRDRLAVADCCLCTLDTTAAAAAPAAPGCFLLEKPGMNMHSAPHVKLSSCSGTPVPTSSSLSCGAMDLPSARDALLVSATGAADGDGDAT